MVMLFLEKFFESSLLNHYLSCEIRRLKLIFSISNGNFRVPMGASFYSLLWLDLLITGRISVSVIRRDDG